MKKISEAHDLPALWELRRKWVRVYTHYLHPSGLKAAPAVTLHLSKTPITSQNKNLIRSCRFGKILKEAKKIRVKNIKEGTSWPRRVGAQDAAPVAPASRTDCETSTLRTATEGEKKGEAEKRGRLFQDLDDAFHDLKTEFRSERADFSHT